MVFAFYGSFCKCVNRRRKIITKKQGQFLKSHSRESLKRFRSNLVCGVLTLAGVSTAKFIKAGQSYGDAKIVFSFYLSIYS